MTEYEEKELIAQLENYHDATRLVFDCGKPLNPNRLADGIIITKEAYTALASAYYTL